ncbi:MAG: GlsB/YeaQ/YmgE family stress response membrane protein [Planctomycetaceae bacterium]|nr:GlsB/YeaQ/YmgE family stress response membrane protein [Planctomycetaceae bacterium]
MGILEFLLLLLIAGVCGSLAQSLVGYSHGGCLVSIVLGFIGALIGTWLARVLSLPEILPVQVGGHSFPIIWSIIGAALFSALLALLSRRPPVVRA